MHDHEQVAQGCQHLLHGQLFVEIREAKDLPNSERWVKSLLDKGERSDPFVDVRLGKARLAKTKVVDDR